MSKNKHIDAYIEDIRLRAEKALNLDFVTIEIIDTEENQLGININVDRGKLFSRVSSIVNNILEENKESSEEESFDD